MTLVFNILCNENVLAIVDVLSVILNIQIEESVANLMWRRKVSCWQLSVLVLSMIIVLRYHYSRNISKAAIFKD